MTSQTVSALFDDYAAASRAVERLKAAGFPENEISIVGKSGTQSTSATGTTVDDPVDDGAGQGATIGAVVGGGAGLLTGLGMMAIPGVGPVVAAGWLATTLLGATAGGLTGGLIGALTDAGVSEGEAHEYAEGIRRGGTLVTVQTSRVAEAVDILDDEGAVDLEDRGTAWRNEGWTGRYDESARATTASPAPSATASTARTGATGSVPIVEEDLKVAKDKQSRRVRVYPTVVDTPVERDVTLRDEKVHVVRRNVDRPATVEDMARQGKALEATETHEVPIIEKQARVVGEVSFEKEVTEHTEKVRDSVRRTDVELDDQRRADRKKGA